MTKHSDNSNNLEPVYVNWTGMPDEVMQECNEKEMKTYWYLMKEAWRRGALEHENVRFIPITNEAIAKAIRTSSKTASRAICGLKKKKMIIAHENKTSIRGQSTTYRKIKLLKLLKMSNKE